MKCSCEQESIRESEKAVKVNGQRKQTKVTINFIHKVACDIQILKFKLKRI